jgi:hypothetical protein
MFAGEDDPLTDDAPEKNPDQKKPKKGTPNKRNKRQASRPPVAASLHELPICLACGLIHKLANCYYAFPKLASSYFEPRNELAAQIKEKLANNINLQKQLKKLKKARRSSSSKSIKMLNTPVPNITVEWLQERKIAKMRGNFATHLEDYFLRFSVILDPATIITIINDEICLINYKLAFINDEIWSDNKALPILGYKTMILKIKNQTMLLENVAYYPRLLTILIALWELRKKGIYWNNQKDSTSLYKRDHTLICFFKDIYG